MDVGAGVVWCPWVNFGMVGLLPVTFRDVTDDFGFKCRDLKIGLGAVKLVYRQCFGIAWLWQPHYMLGCLVGSILCVNAWLLVPGMWAVWFPLGCSIGWMGAYARVLGGVFFFFLFPWIGLG